MKHSIPPVKGPTMKGHNQLNNPEDFLNDLEKEDKKPAFLRKPLQNSKEEKPVTNANITQGQKFFLALLFFVLVLLFGFFIMLITGKMVLPL